MRKSFTYFLCIFFVGIFYSSISAQSVHVPLKNTIYRFIERWEAKGILRNELTGTKPLSRLQIAEFLTAIRKKQLNGLELTLVDRDLLKFYEEEFVEEIAAIDPASEIKKPDTPGWLSGLQQKIHSGFFYKNGKNLLVIKTDDFSLFGDIIAYQDNALTDVDSLESTDGVYRQTTGILLRGSIGERLGFYVDARNTKEWGTRDYPIGRDVTAPGLGWISNFGSRQFHDETNAYVVLRISPFELEIGKNHNRWGSGLLLSDNATSFDYIKLKTRFWRLTFSHIFGSLVQFPRIIEKGSNNESGGKKKFANKYLTAHRLEVNLGKGVNIGLQESVVYGQRGLELAYVNPVMFLRSAEHYLGDQDNALMGFDITLNLIEGLKFYNEFLMDDVFLKRLGTKWWGNKFAYHTSLLWVDPFGIENTSVRLGYTKIKPFVYSHRFPINVYKHYNSSLGSSLKPNSDKWNGAIDYYQTRKLYYSLEIWYDRHGTSPEDKIVGGEINEPVPNPGDEYLGFLKGSVEKKKGFKLRVSYEPLRNLFIAANLEIFSGSNFRINNRTGREFTSKQIFFSIGLNY